MAGVRGKGLARMFMLPIQLLVAFAQSAVAIFKHRPDVVLGMGGYTAFPGGMMAVLFNRPLVIHEQNSIGGLTNRILACLADRIMVAFPAVFTGQKDKPVPCSKISTVWCGNPVRADIAAIEEPETRFAGREGRLRMLVVGGSLGAAALNEAVPKAIALIPEASRPEIVHQTGSKNREQVNAHYAASGVEGEVIPFIDDMATRYAWCDFVLCRAGALTVAELAAAGVASILVPYPHAVDDHQTFNGRFLSDVNGAILIPQKGLEPVKLAQLISGFTREKLLRMAKAARSLRKAEATQMVAEACMELAA
jgi:UDP-N-acetylglucosamine--N-acetylmuramyl-(pentapeptide) pyrophosphoryl-undecaprenol N-acetylglucosamine transferase